MILVVVNDENAEVEDSELYTFDDLLVVEDDDFVFKLEFDFLSICILVNPL